MYYFIIFMCINLSTFILNKYNNKYKILPNLNNSAIKPKKEIRNTLLLLVYIQIVNNKILITLVLVLAQSWWLDLLQQTQFGHRLPDSYINLQPSPYLSDCNTIP